MNRSGKGYLHEKLPYIDSVMSPCTTGSMKIFLKFVQNLSAVWLCTTAYVMNVHFM